MNLLLAGLSHKTAPLEVRERLAMSEGRIPEALQKLQAESEVEEGFILSTCNRVEFVLKVRGDADGLAALRRFMGSYFGLRYDDFAPGFYILHDYDAVRHLLRVAAGLDSVVVGEPQVLGQVKTAYSLAKEAGVAGRALDAVFQRVFTAAKRVRGGTRVAEAPVSVSSAAVELAQAVLGDLHDKTVMVIGAGQMGELAARHFVSKGASTVLVSSRTHAHAVGLAEELRGRAIGFGEIWQAMRHADIVISSTSCPHYIITRKDVRRLMAERAERPLFLIDIAVPRDIEPAVGEVCGCALANVDGLQEIARRNLGKREKAVEAADRIIEEELAVFREHQEVLNVVPTIVSLPRRMEEIRRAELERVKDVVGELTPEQEKALEALTRGLVNKISHAPFTELKQVARRPDRSQLLDAVRAIFRLEDDPVDTFAALN